MRIGPNSRTLLLAAATTALCACGGNGGGEPAAPTLTLGGVAATGRAITNGSVQVKCAAGSGTATTQTDGSYTVSIVGGSLPCVLAVTPVGGGALHSVIDGNGNPSVNVNVSVNVNITPLTELVAAKAAGGPPAAMFATFDAIAQAKLDTAALDAAVTSVASALQGVVNLNGANPVTAPLVAASGSNPGNALDGALDTLQTVLAAAQTTLAELSVAVASGGSAGAVVQQLLQPAAATCASLRSGAYRAFQVQSSAAISRLTIDASALTMLDEGGASQSPFAITPDATTACKFSVPGEFGPEVMLVSKSGLFVVQVKNATGQVRTEYVIPEQILPLSDLAGTWNFLEYWPDDVTHVYTPGAGTLTFDTTGTITGVTACAGLSACAPSVEPAGTFTVDPAGGFAANNAEGTRAFALKTASGQMMLFIINPTIGGVIVATKQAPLSLPAVGAVSNFWDFTIGSTGFATPLVSDVSTTVTSVDAVTGSYTRSRAADGRIDGFTINTPRNGLRHRPAGSSPTNTGVPVNFSAILVMPLADTGVTFYSSLAANENFFGVSIGRP